MALKAGYYGIKKNIKNRLEKLLQYIPESVSADNPLATQSEIDNIWTAQAVVGVKNLWPKYVGSSATPQNVSFTADGDGVVSCEGVASATAVWRQGNRTLKAGKYKVYGGENIGTYNSITYDALVALYNPLSSAYFAPDEETVDTYTFATDTVVQPTIRVQTGVDSSNYVFKPMIYFADDNSVFVPNAMTNQELTASATDQKTAINDIITAATGAADFAAFKTAMGAITPVTRSLSIQAPEIKEASDPEPEPETKTTKRSTKKTETIE